MQTHLFRREGRYYYRRRIPADLIEHYSGRKEVQKALGTSDPREAKRLARALAVAHDDEFQAIREARARQQQAQAVAPPKPEGAVVTDATVGDVHSLAARILERLRREREQAMQAGTLDQFLNKQRRLFDETQHELSGNGLGFDLMATPAWKQEAAVLAYQQLLEPGKYHSIRSVSKPALSNDTRAGSLPTAIGKPVSLEMAFEHWQQHGGHTNTRLFC